MEPVGDVEMIEAIRKEVRRLCNKNAVVSHILTEEQTTGYKDDYNRLLTTQEAGHDHTAAVISRLSQRRDRTISRASEASQRGWDPILAGYQAREILSRAPTPGELRMERSLLPMDLNSASSENSSVHGTEDWSEDDGPETADYSVGEGLGVHFGGELGGTIGSAPPSEELDAGSSEFEGDVRVEATGKDDDSVDPEQTASADRRLHSDEEKQVVCRAGAEQTPETTDEGECRAPEEESSLGEPELLRLVEDEEEGGEDWRLESHLTHPSLPLPGWSRHSCI